MQELDKALESSAHEHEQSLETLIKPIIQQLEITHQNQIEQLSKNIFQLENEQIKLIEKITQLQKERQQQLELRQKIINRIVQGSAIKLQEKILLIEDYLCSTSSSQTNLENTYKLLEELFNKLSEDLSNYQSPISQNLRQLPTLEEQSQAILDTIVNQINNQLELIATTSTPSTSSPSRKESKNIFSNNQTVQKQPNSSSAKIKPSSSQSLWGFLLVTGGSILLSLHYILIDVITDQTVQKADYQNNFAAAPIKIFGLFSWGGFVPLSLGNVLLILWLRMIVVVPLMAILAQWLYPQTWDDIYQFLISKNNSNLNSADKADKTKVMISSVLIFLSQLLLYIAIAKIGVGVAVTIFFIYPILVASLEWLTTGDRFILSSKKIIIFVTVGVVLTTISSKSSLGIATALASGIIFAFYLTIMQDSFKKLHPVPISLIQFIAIFIFTSLGLILPLPPAWKAEVISSNLSSLLIGGVLLGFLTIGNYVFNHFGMQRTHPIRSSIISLSVPVLTALLAYITIPSSQTALPIIQIIGITLVTVGIIVLTVNKIILATKVMKSTHR